MPRTIGSAGDWILGVPAALRGMAARRSRVALSVAIRSHIEALGRHCEAGLSGFRPWNRALGRAQKDNGLNSASTLFV
jgi:hypothetical protein